ncbi:TauD/TfdA family dioxygenase [Pseudonocardia sp. ICBG1293]|uniref:TauD/TfdA family dioxygenase n=1 Tax=Pseudonocardia sp. ICBG1293 TaxID=2844382 RepID=UPI001CCD9F82|nr:TauD/TfdA family dioxygenase [Pseudonocardia sp. ICBG1293]
MIRGAGPPTADPSATDGFGPARVVPGPALATVLRGPEPDTDAVAAARTELGALARTHLDEGPGVLVLTGLDPDEAAAATAIARLSALLGEARPQNREGELLRRVRDRSTAVGEGRRGRYSDSRFGGDLHTDGAEAALPAPDLFTLYCVRQSRRGGALVTVHLDDVLRRLADRPEVIRTLRESFHVDRRGDEDAGDPPTVRKPVLFEQDGRLSISYLRSYIEIGHRHDGVPELTADQVGALDALDAVVADPAVQLVGKLEEGELAVFDNLRLLHGRTEFVDEPDRPRLLVRSWIRRAPRPA